MKILIINDNSVFTVELADIMREHGHYVDHAANVSGASGCLQSGKKYDCLIVDMNMRTIGLTPDQVKATYGGLITGWIWLKEQVFPEYPFYKRRTIICSAYEAEIKEKIPEEYKQIQKEGIIFVRSFKEAFVELEKLNTN